MWKTGKNVKNCLMTLVLGSNPARVIFFQPIYDPSKCSRCLMWIVWNCLFQTWGQNQSQPFINGKKSNFWLFWKFCYGASKSRLSRLRWILYYLMRRQKNVVVTEFRTLSKNDNEKVRKGPKNKILYLIFIKKFLTWPVLKNGK